MINKFTLAILFLVCFTFNLIAQNNIFIKEIKYEGLKKTKSSYLKNFVKSKIGEPLDSAQLEIDKQRLINLEILSNVKYQVIASGNEAVVTFNCTEIITLLPIFNFGNVDNTVWVRAGLSQVNFKGKGIKVSTFYQYNEEHTIFFNSFIPNIKGSKWSVGLNLVSWSSFEPINFDEGITTYLYENNMAGLSAFYNFSYNTRLEIGGSYFVEDYTKQVDLENPTPGPESAHKNKVLGKLIFSHNKENYNYFYVSGFSNTLNLETVLTKGEQDSFVIFFNDFKFFKRIGKKGNVGARFRMGLSTNNDSPFAPFVLDSYVNIRGVGNLVDRGTGVITLNLEHRQSLFENESIAMQAVAFSDLGTWRLPGGTFDDFVQKENIQSFAGAGLRLIYKKAYGAILRIDYGVDTKDSSKGGIVLGVGQYF